MKNGNYNDAKAFTFGTKRQGNLFAIKMRFKTDIANYVCDRFNVEHLFITPTSNKGTQMLYGHCTMLELDRLMQLCRHGKAQRLLREANSLMTA